MMYVVDNPNTVPPVAPVLFTNDLLTYTPQNALGVLYQAHAVTASGGDLYWDGQTVIVTAFTNPAVIGVWTQAAGWTLPLVLNDVNSFLGGPGGSRQPFTGSQAIDFDGATYAVGGYDLNGNTSVWTTNTPSNGPWVNHIVAADGNFDGVQAAKWVSRLSKWVIIGPQIWTAPMGAATWTSRNSTDTFYNQLYDDGSTLWVIGAGFLWSSPDAVTWTQHAYPSPFPTVSNLKGNLFFDSALSLWIGPMQTPNYGIGWATTPVGPWTYGYTSPNNPPAVPTDEPFYFAKVGATLYAYGVRQLVNIPSNNTPFIASSVDDKTWTIQLPALPAPITTNMQPIFAFLEGLVGAPDNSSFGASYRVTPNTAAVNVYSNTAGVSVTTQYTGGRWLHAIPPPAASGAPIPIEWQPPSALLDQGRIALSQRFYVDIDTGGENITLTILVDNTDYPQATPLNAVGRQTIEIPLQISGRIYSIRLTGSLTFAQAEWYESWCDIHTGDPPSGEQTSTA